MKNCKTCANFTRYTSKFDMEYHGANSGVCASRKFVYVDGRTCGEDADSLRYWDYEGYSAGFEVGEKFGCVHWLKRSGEGA